MLLRGNGSSHQRRAIRCKHELQWRREKRERKVMGKYCRLAQIWGMHSKTVRKNSNHRHTAVAPHAPEEWACHTPSLAGCSPRKHCRGGHIATSFRVQQGDLRSVTLTCRKSEIHLHRKHDGGAWWATVQEVAKSQTQLSDFTFKKVYWLNDWPVTHVIF